LGLHDRNDCTAAATPGAVRAAWGNRRECCVTDRVQVVGVGAGAGAVAAATAARPNRDLVRARGAAAGAASEALLAGVLAMNASPSDDKASTW
jgi:hypothetical protein